MPLPGLNAGPHASRIVLALALTTCLLPLWPAVKSSASFGGLVLWIAPDGAGPLTAGLAETEPAEEPSEEEPAPVPNPA